MIFSTIILASLLGSYNELGIQATRGTGTDKAFSVSYARPGLLTLGARAGLVPHVDIFGKSTYFVEADVGSTVEAGPFYGKFLVGLTLFSETRPGLISVWQFPTIVSGGIQNDIARIGVLWQHFSNGSNSRRNTGLDFMGIEVGFKLK